MKAQFRVLVFAWPLLAIPFTQAQISYGGLAFGLMPNGPRLPEAPALVMPSVDAAVMIAEDEARLQQGIKGPYRFGFNHQVEITMEAGLWTELPSGDRIWRLGLVCPEAFSVGLVFSHYVIPTGALVFIYNEAGQQLGAFMATPGGRTSLGVDQLAGDRITIEYFEPAAVHGQGDLVIGQVTHDYRDVTKAQRGFGDSGECNINVICPEGDDWRDQIRSVALINTGGGFCTGTLLNNCALDGTPYFLTANHCLGGSVDNWVFRFNWDSPVCTPTENAPTDMTVSGSELLVNEVSTDMALLQLSSAPPLEYDVFYSGWNSTDLPATQVTGIHHPSGDIKKISHSTMPVIEGEMIGAQSWLVQVWAQGTTEPGSSGSGLWGPDSLLVGQLVGGAANCANSVQDFYGRFDLSWPFVEQWLGDCGPTLEGLGSEFEEPVTVDAAVTSISNVPMVVCGTNSITPTVTLKNNGEDVLTSITITYGVVGGIMEITVWNGSLLPGQTVNHTLPPLIVPPGDHILQVTTDSPNGFEDQVEENDTWTFDFTMNSPSETIELALTLDDYGSEVTWVLENLNGTELYTGGPYEDGLAGEQIIIPFCLTNGCYTFTINDTFGDGICCGEGEGGYSIQDGNGNIHALSNGQYEFQNVNDFCLLGVSVDGSILPNKTIIFPNPANTTLYIELGGSIDPDRLSLYDNVGRIIDLHVVQQDHLLTVDLSGVANGIYSMVLEFGDQREVHRVMVQH